MRSATRRDATCSDRALSDALADDVSGDALGDGRGLAGLGR